MEDFDFAIKPFKTGILADGDGNFEKGILKLKKLWSLSIAMDYRRHESFVSRGEMRRQKRRRAVRRLKRREVRIEEAISGRNYGRRSWRPAGESVRRVE